MAIRHFCCNILKQKLHWDKQIKSMRDVRVRTRENAYEYVSRETPETAVAPGTGKLFLNVFLLFINSDIPFCLMGSQ